MVNGEIVEKRDFDIGEYTIDINRAILDNEIFIEIYAESSGLRMWAPSYYELSDLSITVKGFAQNSFAYAFMITEEYNMFNEGRLELSFDENIGEIVITINDREVYSGPVKNLESFRFDKSYLRYGQNYMAIFAKENSKFSGNAKMLIFYKTIYPTRLEVPFSFNQTEYNKLKTGRITFDVIQVTSGGGVSVKIVNDNQVTYNAYGTLGEGSYEFTFDKSNVRIGTNILVIDSVDKGIFAIKNVAIRV